MRIVPIVLLVSGIIILTIAIVTPSTHPIAAFIGGILIWAGGSQTIINRIKEIKKP